MFLLESLIHENDNGYIYGKKICSGAMAEAEIRAEQHTVGIVHGHDGGTDRRGRGEG